MSDSLQPARKGPRGSLALSKKGRRPPRRQSQETERTRGEKFGGSGGMKGQSCPTGVVHPLPDGLAAPGEQTGQTQILLPGS